jgi:hypothetical protein
MIYIRRQHVALQATHSVTSICLFCVSSCRCMWFCVLKLLCGPCVITISCRAQGAGDVVHPYMQVCHGSGRNTRSARWGTTAIIDGTILASHDPMVNLAVLVLSIAGLLNACMPAACIPKTLSQFEVQSGASMHKCMHCTLSLLLQLSAMPPSKHSTFTQKLRRVGEDSIGPRVRKHFGTKHRRNELLPGLTCLYQTGYILQKASNMNFSHSQFEV